MTEQPQPEPAPEERPLWKLNRDDQRVLFVTFVGGVASIIVAASIVGGAIAFARTFERANKHHWLGLQHAELITFYILAFVLLLTMPGILGRKKTGTLARVRRSAVRAVLWIVLLAGILILLTVIGIAAGIH